MHVNDIPWKRSGTGRAVTLCGLGDRVFDLYQDRLDSPLIQVCEFPCIGADGDARTLTYWIQEDGLAVFLARECCSAEHSTREAA
ncbi:hypothetical protein PQI07_22710 [Methylobacterium sp. 092160098-2]|uniref:hypothetical protein n=1 Tax=Methylobacterium sp. 092160098-2 TaxID=3025129 RepID=UPI002381C7F6|nr:hypothetical protein [Methylobacterium sp. 092160098-2]MDE4913496.1 hypothetical protein [Methylobacterium sp. 092160098-2]